MLFCKNKQSRKYLQCCKNLHHCNNVSSPLIMSSLANRWIAKSIPSWCHIHCDQIYRLIFPQTPHHIRCLSEFVSNLITKKITTFGDSIYFPINSMTILSLNLVKIICHHICHKMYHQMHHKTHHPIWWFTKLVTEFVTNFATNFVTKFVTKFFTKFIT